MSIDESFHDQNLQALRWLAFSKRTLSTTELAEAVAAILVSAGQPPIFDPLNRLSAVNDIFYNLLKFGNRNSA